MMPAEQRDPLQKGPPIKRPEHRGASAREDSKRPTLHYSHYSITPLLHYSITPLLHYSITPLLHYSITPLLHYSITPLLLLHPDALTRSGSPSLGSDQRRPAPDEYSIN